VTVGALLGSQVVTEDGRRLGGVYDARLEVRDGRPRVLALAYGAPALRKRLAGSIDRSALPAQHVLWSDVVRVEPSRIVVRRRS
jgi:sporulation protein YlmC with PRC-barrel domain